MDNLDLWQLKEYTSMKPGLRRIKQFLRLVGNPQDTFKSVLITGSNGKGSTACMLASLLSCGGYKTGLYTSPHLISMNERIRIDTKCIPMHALRSLARKHIVLAKKCRLTYFEFLTSIAFIYFREKKIDLAVLEIGLGGRFDAVNVIANPCVSIVTDISLEHCSILGNTLEKIAFEKAGIIKPCTPIVSGVSHEAASKIIRHEAKRKNATLFELGSNFRSTRRMVNWKEKKQTYLYQGLRNKFPVELSLLGEHQIKNSMLALAATELLQNDFYVAPTQVNEAMQNVRWPGRFDINTLQNKTYILDGAHNPGAVRSFINTWEESPWGKQKQTFIFGVLRDKDYTSMIRELSPFVGKVIIAPVKSLRNLDPHTCKTAWKKYIDEENIIVAESVKDAIVKSARAPVVVVIGSLYLVGTLLKKGGIYGKKISGC